MLDTSVLARRAKPEIQPKLDPLLEAGLVARCTVTDLEAGVAARGGKEHRVVRRERSTWPLVEINQATLDRAWDVQSLLADRSQHRGVKIADLLVAAAAEEAELVVLHYDRDYDRIAEVTAQPTEWIVRAGSVN